MNEIRPWLYTSNFHVTEEAHTLKEYGIGAMLELFHFAEQEGVASLFLPMQDAADVPDRLLEQGINFVLEQKAAGNIVLIACGAGISRSSTLAIAALKIDEDLGLKDAFFQVREGNPKAMPDEPQWNALCRYFNEDVDFWDLWATIMLD